jgi:hypothetical protein
MPALLNGLPAIAVNYAGMVSALEHYGWGVRRVAEHGEDGFHLHLYHEERTEPDGMPQRASVIVSQAPHPEPDGSGDQLWLHASIYLGDDVTPTYEDLCMLHAAVFGRRRYAWQCFVPGEKHVNIRNALHLWGRVDGRNVLPDFGREGTI